MINATIHLMSGPAPLIIYRNTGYASVYMGRYSAIHEHDEGTACPSGNGTTVQAAIDELIDGDNGSVCAQECSS